MKTLLDKINVSGHIAHHIVGKEHTDNHRRIAGFFIMVIGVGIAKSAHFIPFLSIEVLLDIIGYGIHGVGLIPFIHNMEKEKRNIHHKNNINTTKRVRR